jgi:hypothetical protein
MRWDFWMHGPDGVFRRDRVAREPGGRHAARRLGDRGQVREGMSEHRDR